MVKLGVSFRKTLVAAPQFFASMHTKAFAKRSSALITAGVLFLTILPAFLLMDIFAPHAKAMTASQGPLTTTASSNCTEDASAGTTTWTSPGNAATSDNAYASTSVDGTTSRYLKCLNFGFSIPTGVTIAGIVVSLERKSDSTGNGGSQDAAIRLVKAGAIGTTDRSTTTIYTTADVSENHGSTSDLWGTTWASSDINATNFGAAIAVKKASAAGAAHSVTVDVVTISVTYTFNPSFNQSSYRWFNNTDASGSGAAIDVGTTIAAQSTAITSLAEQSIMRLRMTVHTSVDPAISGYFSFKLQYAQQGSDNVCDTSFTGETYADITSTTPIAYGDNTVAADGQTLTVNANDPKHSTDTNVTQEYNESGNTNVVNTIAAGQDGLWDFPLKDNGAPASTTYCFRLVTDTGTQLPTYTVVPQLTTLPPDFTQENYRWFKGQDGVPNNTFMQALGGSASDIGEAITQTSDGGYIVSGETATYGAGGNDMFIAKYDASGLLSWSKTLGGTGDEYGYGVAQTKDGGYVVTGGTSSYGAGGSDAFIAKYTTTGSLTWIRTWGGTGTDVAYGITQTADTGFAIVGKTDSFGAGSTDSFVAKYDSAGTLTWSRTWGGTGADAGNGIIQNSTGRIVITGQTASYGSGANDAFVVQYDETGNVAWNKTWGGSSDDMGQSITQTSDGGYAVTGKSSSGGAGGYDAFISKYDANGTLSWAKKWGGTGNDYGKSVVQTTDGGYAVAGQTFSFSDTTNGDGFLAKFDSSGGLTWSKSFGSTNVEQINALMQTSDNGFAMTGQIASYGSGSNDVLIAKALYDGSMQGCPVSICTSPTATSASSTGSETSPSATTTSPAASMSSPSVTVSSPSPNATPISGNMTFAKVWGDTGGETANAVAAMSDGGYVITGKTKSYRDTTSGDMYIARFDSTGVLQWSRTWGGPGSDEGKSIVATSDGGIMVAGDSDTSSFGGGGSLDLFLVKYNSSGTMQWNETWGGSGIESVSKIIQTSDGGYALTGEAAGPTQDMLVMKFTSTGSISWNRIIDDIDNGGEKGYGIAELSGGNLVAVGAMESGLTSNSTLFVTILSSSGSTISYTNYGQYDTPSSVSATSDGGYIVSGTDNNADMYIAKFTSKTSAPELSWAKSWGAFGKQDTSSSAIQTNDGGYLLTGTTASAGAGGDDIAIIKFDSSGTFKWNKTWGGTGSESARMGIQMQDSGFAVVGATSSYGAGLNDSLLLKFTNAGEMGSCGASMCQSPTVSTGMMSLSEIGAEQYGGSVSPAFLDPNMTVSSPSANSSYIISSVLWSQLSAFPGIPLGAQDTIGVSLQHDDPIRLRFILKNVKSALGGTASFKLQVSPKVGNCDTGFTGETYVDIDSSNSFTYYDNSNLMNGDVAASSSFDPAPASGSLLYDNYQESANFTNRQSFTGTQNGLWDISLSTTANTLYNSYCFRVVKSDNSLLSGYTRVFELSIPPSVNQQMRHGKFFSETTTAGTADSRQPFYW
jgi:hypothetical protein